MAVVVVVVVVEWPSPLLLPPSRAEPLGTFIRAAEVVVVAVAVVVVVVVPLLAKLEDTTTPSHPLRQCEEEVEVAVGAVVVAVAVGVLVVEGAVRVRPLLLLPPLAARSFPLSRPSFLWTTGLTSASRSGSTKLSTRHSGERKRRRRRDDFTVRKERR